jgi:hypothetical protein
MLCVDADKKAVDTIEAHCISVKHYNCKGFGGTQFS